MPAEYASSWCLASSSLPLLEIKPLKQLKIALNEANLANHFASPAMKQLEQFKDIQPFVLMLDDITDIQTMKNLTKFSIEVGLNRITSFIPNKALDIRSIWPKYLDLC